jgi:Uma2 family endonuclease
MHPCPRRFGPGFLQLAPDLAIDVLSPTNRAGKIKQKVADDLTAGTRLVWIIDPAKRRVSVVTPSAPAVELNEGEWLDGANVVPGFRCLVDALFEGAAQ